MTARATGETALRAAGGRSTAISVRISRNVVVQVLGMGMVCLTGLAVLPWRVVLAWAVVAVAVLTTENQVLRAAARAVPNSRTVRLGPPTLRVLATTLYALAALAFIIRGGPGEQLVAFALVSASMVHVLMRYYRSPIILAASLSPWVIVLALVSFGLATTAWQQGRPLSALVATFTIGIMAVQFWSAREQLSESWMALKAAREAAEVREKAAEAANRAKSEFLANMSHELRTPLNGVLGMAQALTNDKLTHVQQEQVGIIRQSSESLLSVLNDLLDLSRIEASALRLEMIEFELDDLVSGVVAAYQPTAMAKGLALDLKFSPQTSGRYVGDAARVRRILHGLLDNAIKFTAAGRVALEVANTHGHIAFRVSDTGVGIAEADRAHLFQGFFQADATLTRRFGGAGVGLAICNELAKLMGGVIEAESTLGAGSTFTVKLPMPRADAGVDLTDVGAELSTSDPTRIETPASALLHVLAAEDNLTNQLVLKTLLAPAGISPTMVENGREAVAAWESQPWDVILMDIQMPEMNGIDATRAVRLREAQTGRARTPIVAVTANTMTHQVVEYEAAGMDGVVAKPIDMAKLFETIEAALAQAVTSTQSCPRAAAS